MTSTNKAPVCLFYYNRPGFVVSSIAALEECKELAETDVYIFVDGPKNAKDLEKVELTLENISEIDSTMFGSLNVTSSNQNRGLANSIIAGVSHVLRKHGRVIVLEDDLIVSSNFLAYMNLSLDYYESEKSVGSIGGFGFDVKKRGAEDNFFHHRPTSWGWATWITRWELAIWDISGVQVYPNKELKIGLNRGGEDLYRMLKAYSMGKIDSWAIRWAYSHYVHDWVASCPYRSKVKNIGYGDEATNCDGSNPFNIQFDETGKEGSNLLNSVEVDHAIIREMNWYNSNIYRALCKIGVNKYVRL